MNHRYGNIHSFRRLRHGYPNRFLRCCHGLCRECCRLYRVDCLHRCNCRLLYYRGFCRCLRNIARRFDLRPSLLLNGISHGRIRCLFTDLSCLHYRRIRFSRCGLLRNGCFLYRFRCRCPNGLLRLRYCRLFHRHLHCHGSLHGELTSKSLLFSGHGDIRKLQTKTCSSQGFIGCFILRILKIPSVGGFFLCTAGSEAGDGFHIRSVQKNLSFINRHLLCHTQTVQLDAAVGIQQPEPQLLIGQIQLHDGFSGFTGNRLAKQLHGIKARNSVQGRHGRDTVIHTRYCVIFTHLNSPSIKRNTEYTVLFLHIALRLNWLFSVFHPGQPGTGFPCSLPGPCNAARSAHPGGCFAS